MAVDDVQSSPVDENWVGGSGDLVVIWCIHLATMGTSFLVQNDV